MKDCTDCPTPLHLDLKPSAPGVSNVSDSDCRTFCGTYEGGLRVPTLYSGHFRCYKCYIDVNIMTYGDLLIIGAPMEIKPMVGLKKKHVAYLQFINILVMHGTSEDYVPT